MTSTTWALRGHAPRATVADDAAARGTRAGGPRCAVLTPRDPTAPVRHRRSPRLAGPAHLLEAAVVYRLAPLASAPGRLGLSHLPRAHPSAHTSKPQETIEASAETTATLHSPPRAPLDTSRRTSRASTVLASYSPPQGSRRVFAGHFDGSSSAPVSCPPSEGAPVRTRVRASVDL